MSRVERHSSTSAEGADCLGLLASKAIGPTAARGQLYGIAAAVGKGEHRSILCERASHSPVGAFIGTYTFPQIIAHFGGSTSTGGVTVGLPARACHGSASDRQGPFYLGSGLALVSALVTFFFIPNIKPDSMHEEDIRFREYLLKNGYDVSK